MNNAFITTMIAKTRAIVLKSFDFRETSRIATFFTEDYGKISGVLKGIRKDPKKFSTSLDRYSLNEILYYRYSRSELHLVGHCDQLEVFPVIRSDYRKLGASYYGLELADKIMAVEQPNKEIFRLMLDFIRSLGESEDIDQLVHLFQIKILSLSGFRPLLDCCVGCEQKISGPARFSPNAGGLMCGRCPSPVSREDTVISQGAVATLLKMEEFDWMQSRRVGLTPMIRRELKYLLNNFLVYHLERKIHAAAFLG